MMACSQQNDSKSAKSDEKPLKIKLFSDFHSRLSFDMTFVFSMRVVLSYPILQVRMLDMG